MRKIEQILEISPMSINKCYRGRRFATKDFLKWQKDGLLLMGNRETILGDVSVHFDFRLKHPNMCDVDNLIKTALDLTVKRGWIKDDRQVQYLEACKLKSRRESIRIFIREM